MEFFFDKYFEIQSILAQTILSYGIRSSYEIRQQEIKKKWEKDMSRIAFTFPGQGAQYIGMGKGFYDTEPVCRQVMECASEAAGLNLPQLCFEENDKINITEYTQIAMLSVSVAMLKAMEEKGLHPDVAAGLSLGEYGALVACGAMAMEDAFAVVRKRGIYMQEAVPTGGAMSAVLGLEAGKIEAVCAQTKGQVSVANYNCPGQIVITGEEKAVEAASLQLREAGAKRVLPLKVSGPFHSPMLTGAGERLKEALEPISIQAFETPYVTNVTGTYVTKPGAVKGLLVQQVSSSVRWQQCVEAMIADGVDTFVEIGPGRTLTGFLRKIDRNLKSYSIEKPEDVDMLLKALA